MKWLKDLFKPKVIKVQYCRIRKPKKGEAVLFKLPTNDPETLARFGKRFEAQKDKNYWVISGNIEVKHISNKSKVVGD